MSGKQAKPNKREVKAKKIPKKYMGISLLSSTEVNNVRICTYCSTEVALGDYHCHKCGVEYEEE